MQATKQTSEGFTSPGVQNRRIKGSNEQKNFTCHFKSTHFLNSRLNLTVNFVFVDFSDPSRRPAGVAQEKLECQSYLVLR